MSSYTVEHHPYGILIFGQLPVEDFCALATSMPPNSVLHDGIAKHYRALACMSPGDKASQWEAEIEAEVAKLPPQERFLRGTQTGTSSVTIFVALTDSPQLKAQSQSLYPEVSKDPIGQRRLRPVPSPPYPDACLERAPGRSRRQLPRHRMGAAGGRMGTTGKAL
jgi:hypothetical protein